jgi:uncharacterized protein YhjY with autotransporter beta-barrel domain
MKALPFFFDLCSRASKYALPSVILVFALMGASAASAQTTGGMLTVEIAGTASGTVTSVDDNQQPDGQIACPGDCSQSYFSDQTVTLTAVPDTAPTGVEFVGWQGGSCLGSNTAPNCDVLVAQGQSVNITAVFDAPAAEGGFLSVNTIGTGSGSVTSSDQNINCPSDCSHNYTSTDTVTLSPTPATGSTFTGWSGACSGTGSCVITMSGSQSVSANFTADVQTGGLLSVTTDGPGTGVVTSNDGNIFCPDDCSQNYSSSDTVILTADPGIGQVFTGWQGENCSGTGSCTLTMSGDRSVTAVFDIETDPLDVTLSVDLAGTGTGNVVSDDQDINCPGSCSQLYPVDDTVTLTATADADSVFVGWQGAGCSGTSPCTINMAANRNVTAVFDTLTIPPEQDATLTVATNGSGSGSVQSRDQGIVCPEDCSETYPLNTVVTLSATADANSLFSGWQGGGCSGTGSCTVTLSQSLTVTATFDVPATPQADLNVTIDGSGSGTVQSDDESINCPDGCSQSYDVGTVVTLTATALGDSIFAGWEGGGCSGTGSCAVTMAGNRNVSALFQTDGDTDNDLVPNTIDQCPNTPAGQTVDEVGCSVTQPNPTDGDQDGVPDTLDQCPSTPQGEPVDEVGCSDNDPSGPEDEDSDGVANTIDQCPNTPTGESVNEFGCSGGQQPTDDDDDGVPNNEDFCANTPAGESADATGCSSGQVDSDGDGVVDTADACPDTQSYVAAVDMDGCPTTVQFGNQLGGISGLGFNEQRLGGRLDEICPMLILLEDDRALTAGEQDLRRACLRLKDTRTTDDQASFALREISVTELASQKDYATDIANSQYRHVGNRMNQVKTGGGGGVSVAGLNLGIDGQNIPDHVLQSALGSILGMGAGDDSFVDFGKLGLFIQGDLDFGDRDETALESGYDFDAWSITLGGDYRFTDTVFGGASLSLGEVEVDYDRNGGSTDISNWSVSLYSGWSVTENFYLDGLISYGQSDLESERNIGYVDAGGSFGSTHEGDTDGDQLFVGINSGYVLNRGSWRFGPTASIAYTDGSIDAFTETSQGSTSQAWNFDVDQQDYESLRLSLGAQADYIYNTSFGVIIPGIRVSYVLEQEDDADEIAMRLVNNPFTEGELSSDQIVVRSDGQDSDYLDASFNLSGQFVMGFSGFMSYQFYTGFDDYSRSGFTIGARWDKPF